MQLSRGAKELRQGVQVELVGEHLDDDLHKVLLRNDVLAVDDLLEDGGQDHVLVHVDLDALELREADEVRTDKDAEVAALHLALLALARVALVLQPHPELVHLDEVGKHKADRVLEVAAWPYGISTWHR